MKTPFKDIRFGTDRLRLISLCSQVIERYLGMGLRLTLRQLYYQLVTQNAITNAERSYKNLGNAVSDGRLAGLIDWDAIEDRVRVPRLPQQFDNLSDLVDAALRAYRLPRWNGQPEYVELWVEKDALSGVLAPLATEYHIALMVNRGYSSQSAMYEAANRFIANSAIDPNLPNTHAEGNERSCFLLYLGDHDPSGEDMVRDVDDRLRMMGADVEVEKIALTMRQVEQYNPPPNPAKMTDSRAKAYVAQHGSSSWEVDALPPEVLQALVRQAIEEHLDKVMIETVKAQEEWDKNRLQGFVAGLDDNATSRGSAGK